MEGSIKPSSPQYVYEDFDRIHSDDEEGNGLVIAEEEESGREKMPSTITEALIRDPNGQIADGQSPSCSLYGIPKIDVVSPNRHDRMRLRPWLIRQIDSGKHPGLAWLNEEKSLFRIPWMHRSKREWTLEHSGVFLEWAKHTGKYREGIDTPDFVHMKTRLRCAFNKAPDIEEVAGIQKVKNDIPYKIYRLLPIGSNKFTNMAENDKGKPKGNKRSEFGERNTEYGLSISIESQMPPQTYTVTSPVTSPVISPPNTRGYPFIGTVHAISDEDSSPAIQSSEAAAVETLVNLGGGAKTAIAQSHSSQGNIVYILNGGSAIAQNRRSSIDNLPPDTPDSLPAFDELLPTGSASAPRVERHVQEFNCDEELTANIKQEELSDDGGNDSYLSSPMDDAVGALLSLNHNEDTLPLRSEILDLRSKVEDDKPDWDGTGVLDLSTKRTDDEIIGNNTPPGVSNGYVMNQQGNLSPDKTSNDSAKPADTSIQGWSLTADGLQTRFSELIDLENKLMDYKLALDTRAESLAGKEAQLDHRENVLDAKERVLEARDRELKNRQAKLEEHDVGIKEKEEEVQACEKQLRLKEELLICKEKRLKLEIDNMMSAFGNQQQGEQSVVSALLSQGYLPGQGAQPEAAHQGKVSLPRVSAAQYRGPAVPQGSSSLGRALPPQSSPPEQGSQHRPRGMITRPTHTPQFPSSRTLTRSRILPSIKESPRAAVPPVQTSPETRPTAPFQVSIKPSSTKPEAQTTPDLTYNKPSAEPIKIPAAHEKTVNTKGSSNGNYSGDPQNMTKDVPDKINRTHNIIENLRKRVYTSEKIVPDAGPCPIPAKQSRILPPV